MQKVVCCACSMHVTLRATVWVMYRQRVGFDLLPAAGSSLTRLPAACTGLTLLVAAPARLLDAGPVPRLRRQRLRRLHTQRRRFCGSALFRIGKGTIFAVPFEGKPHTCREWVGALV